MIESETPDVRADVAATLADYGETPVVEIEGLTFSEEPVLGEWYPAE